MRIGALVVDDEADIRFLVRSLIDVADKGLYVEAEASLGAEALERLEVFSPDVVVLDQMMPDMSGIEVAEIIRQRWPRLPIVLFSAYLDDAVRAEAAAAGVTRTLGKTEFTVLTDVLHEVVSH